MATDASCYLVFMLSSISSSRLMKTEKEIKLKCIKLNDI